MKTIQLETVDSTNTYAKTYLRENGAIHEPLLVLAEEQTGGRGRKGKSFSSVKGNGIYMTLCLPFSIRPEEAVFVTAAAGTAVRKALYELTGEEFTIKWVNDIYLRGKKVAGILTEAVTDPETGLLRYAVTGVGINLNADIGKMPKEVQAVAGTIPYAGDASAVPFFVASRIQETVELAFSGKEGRKAVLSSYREHSFLTGKHVTFTENGVLFEGRVQGIDDGARLLVVTKEGLKALDSGEVSVKFPRKKEVF